MPRPHGSPCEISGHRTGPVRVPQVRADALSRVITLPPVPRAVRAAREWARQTLTRWRFAESAEVTEHLVSELVTNSIEHAEDGMSVIVLMMYAAGTLRLEVRDHDPINVPLLKNPGPADTGGRGLVIVRALSDRWGVRLSDTGKSVWCEIVLPRPRATAGSVEEYPGAGHDE
jgi:anti-sigma regulatory factor (Ser/Thr protein kinase)